MRSREANWAATAILFVLAGCQRAPAVGAAAAAPSAAEAGYAAPPELISAVLKDGRLTLRGKAAPESLVRLDSPDGSTRSAEVNGSGDWLMTLAPPTSPAMFAFSAETSERTVRGEGAILLTPAPGPPALLLRAGFGALALGQGGTVPQIVTVDYDANGGAAVAGLAALDTPVRLNLDGGPAGLGETDSKGRFAVMATNRTLAAGARRIEVETQGGRAQVVVTVSDPAPLQGQAYRASKIRNGWRIDWAPTGGGVQTTLVFGPPGGGV